MMLRTNRLEIRPLSTSEAELYQKDSAALCTKLGLGSSQIELTEEFEKVLVDDIIPKLKRKPEELHKFITVWIIIDTTNKRLIGDCCFKDLPDTKGNIEIGYAIYPAYQKQGFMSEALGGISNWALNQVEVHAIVADTRKTNIASQKVLQKAGFVEIASCLNFIRWQLVRNQVAQ